MPPPHGRFMRNANRDYVLLNDTGEDVDPEKAAQQRVSPARLFSLSKGEIPTLVLATVFLLLSSLTQVAFPKLAGELIDVAINSQQPSGSSPEAAQRRTNLILAQIIAVVVLGGVAGGLRSWLFQSAAERVMYRLRVNLFKSLVNQEVGFYDRVRTGELTNRLSEDTRLMKSVATTSLSMALRALTVTVLGLVMMFLTSWLLALLTVAIIPPLFLLFTVYGRLSRRYVKEQLAASAQATTVAEEAFSNLRTVRAFAKEEAMLGRYEGAQGQTLTYGLRSAKLDGAFMSLNSSLATGAIMVVLWFGARLVLEDKLTAGALSAFVVYAVFVASNAGMLMGVFSQALGASERVFQLLDRQPAMPPSGDLRPSGAPEGGELRLQGVWFAYPSRPSSWVLKGVDLHVEPGKKVALVGPSGGGKSTIVALLERFYDPARGAVSLDGVALPLLGHAFLHQQVALVSQEPVLFADTIFANIAFGCEEVPTQEQVEAAARVANAHDFISALPHGYHTAVGERGVRLSGGQKQRVAIARAVILNPRVLLLDEATSALDAESEHLVQEALERVSSGRTVVVIAHRLSTVQTADEVAVVQDGTIAERGTHDGLLTAGGVFAALVRRQLLGGGAAGVNGGSTGSLHEVLARAGENGRKDAEKDGRM
ncbi:hypothetical protein N2152v2_002269 [Parachlorella kessleri]